jgi:hypothetical protein
MIVLVRVQVSITSHTDLDPVAYQPRSRRVPTPIPSRTNLDPVAYQPRSHRVPTSIPSRTNLDPIACRPRSRRIPTSIPSHTDLDPVAYQPRSRRIPISIRSRTDLDPIAYRSRSRRVPTSIPSRSDPATHANRFGCARKHLYASLALASALTADGFRSSRPMPWSLRSRHRPTSASHAQGPRSWGPIGSSRRQSSRARPSCL